MKDTKIIGNGQLVSILFLCRVFQVLVLIPRHTAKANGSAIVFATFIYMAIAVLIIILCQMLFKKCGNDNLFVCAQKQGKAFGTIISSIYFLFFVFFGASTMANFEYFLTTAVYPYQSSLMINILLIICTAYVVFMGPEAFGRMSVLITVLFIFVLAIVVVTSIPYMDMLFLHSPFAKGYGEVLTAVWTGFVASNELVLIYFYGPMAGKKFLKAGVIWAILTAAILATISFATLTVLGYFGATQQYPIYALFSQAGLTVFERLEAFYMTVWIFIGIVKSSVYLYAASQTLTFISFKLDKKKSVIIVSVLMAGVSILFSKNSIIFSFLFEIAYTGIPLITCSLLIPLLLLFKCRKKEKVQ